MSELPDHLDITAWNTHFEQIHEELLNPSTQKKRATTKIHFPFEVDAIDLYALLKCKVSKKPNGIFTFLGANQSPIDSFVWWDFILSSLHGYMHVWRTGARLECTFSVDIPDFDIEEFFLRNFEKYRPDILAAKREFERHSLYFNHFESYRNSATALWEEFRAIDTRSPALPASSVVESSAKAKELADSISDFTKRLSRAHIIGKSAILNSAFAIEALVNNLLRIGCSFAFRDRPEILDQSLNQKFQNKLRSLDVFCPVICRLDMNSDTIKRSLSLMTLRNKFAHADESSEHNYLGEVLFDGPYPVFHANGVPYVIQNIERTFAEPKAGKVKEAFETMEAFAVLIEESIRQEVRKELWSVLRTNPLGFNEAKKVYSSIFTSSPAHYFMVGESKA